MQDWAVEVADEHRVFEFSRALSAASKTEEKVCMLDLVLASVDEWMLAHEPVERAEIVDISRRLRPLIGPALREFSDVAEYWVGNDFPAAEVVRAILSETEDPC
jgi:hypothetical protein